MRVLTGDELVAHVHAQLEAQPRTSNYSHFSVAPDPAEAAAYALIVGAGLSFGVVPLVRELMYETIGDYYFPDQGHAAMERPVSVLRKKSADFWAELNQAAATNGLPLVAVN